MDTACESRDVEQAQELLLFFIKDEKCECFSAMLYTCYDLLKPDYVMEVSWRHGFSDIAMPYMIQVMSECVSRVDVLEKRSEERGVKDEEKEKQDMNMMGSGVGNTLMLTQGGGGVPQQQQQQFNANGGFTNGY
jgi:clathrin heavy chain